MFYPHYWCFLICSSVTVYGIHQLWILVLPSFCTLKHIEACLILSLWFCSLSPLKPVFLFFQVLHFLFILNTLKWQVCTLFFRLMKYQDSLPYVIRIISSICNPPVNFSILASWIVVIMQDRISTILGFLNRFWCWGV